MNRIKLLIIDSVLMWKLKLYIEYAIIKFLNKIKKQFN